MPEGNVAPGDPAALDRAAWLARAGLLLGNFAIGCGVMVAPGSLNDLARSLEVPVAVGGQLTSVGAVAMCLGAPLLAAALAGFDRRRLLTLSLLWFAVGHLLCALAPNFALLLPLRAAAVLAAAVFTPQAAAAIGHMSPPQQRGRAITTVFLGWSVASVLGAPLHAWISEVFGWRWAYGLVAGLSLAGMAVVWRVIPDGVRPPALSLASWRRVFTHPVLMAMVAVTALFSAGQFTPFAYIAPWLRQVRGASPEAVSLFFFWFGAFGVMGNLLLSRHVDRIGPARATGWMIAAMALGMALWPLSTGMTSLLLLITPWAFGCFSSNSAQQARFGLAAPELAGALMALNTSAIYLGQALGAGGGGLLLAASGYDVLPWVGLAWLLAAWALSHWAARQPLHLHPDDRT